MTHGRSGPPRGLPSQGMPGFEVICTQGADPKVVLTWREALALAKKSGGRCRIRPARAATLGKLDRLERRRLRHVARGNRKPVKGCGCGG